MVQWSMINLEEAEKLLRYDPDTGIFTWLPRPWLVGKAATWNVRFAGKPAGGLDDRGYVQIRILGKHIRAHILAWLFTYREQPKEIDHRNQNKGDNRIANLRLCNRSENMQNVGLRKHNTSGHTGVSWFAQTQKWEAYITHNRKKRRVGYFTDLADAVTARREAEIEYGYSST